jgi:hypothetical protein
MQAGGRSGGRSEGNRVRKGRGRAGDRQTNRQTDRQADRQTVQLAKDSLPSIGCTGMDGEPRSRTGSLAVCLTGGGGGREGRGAAVIGAIHSLGMVVSSAILENS